MQRYSYLVCGFNGFNQFTNCIYEKSNGSTPPDSEVDLTSSRRDDEDDKELFFVHPKEIKYLESLFFSWSSLYTTGGDGNDYKHFGFSEGGGNSSDGCQITSSEQGILQQSCIQVEYSDCPRGFGFCSIDQLKWNLKGRFYLIGNKGVFEAREVARSEDGSKRHDYNLSRFTIPDETVVQSLSCGKEHVVLVTSKGHVYSFGSGSRGQLGMGSLENRSSPTILEALDPLYIKMVAAGGWHSLALTNSGDVYSWGWNESGQLGIGCFPDHDQLSPQKACNSEESCKRLMLSSLPVLVDCQYEVEKMSCGTRHSAAIFIDKTLWTWGWNRYGQLGLGDQSNRHCPSMVQTFSIGSYMPTDVVCNGWNTLISVIVKES